ncbi:NAD(P)/FAD-dependent oxidoreductase [Sphingomonas flavalba]|uniref:NAD(P)/FAD-dependent oxidoreductase n=1 Tax=Sphingomonas flavalba TaxID=2559804 RepID=UPI00109DE36A|nr:FAD-dependent oxidoreductase [Sphingomonas flavalba]
MSRYAVAIVGAGMAGASLAAEIAPHAPVLLIEAEDRPGYHATGRSAAFWDETYGGPGIQPLTSASGPWLRAEGVLAPRGSLHIARAGQEALLDRFEAEFAGTGVRLDRLDRAALAAALPSLRPGWIGALSGPSCTDIDVAGLHALYLARAHAAGAQLVLASPLRATERRGGVWHLTAGERRYEAEILVDAAGAWADPVAALAGARPIGIGPKRRTMVQLAVAPPAAATMPLILGVDETFYFKPEAGGRIWLSPHDETPSPPCDAAPEEIDVAIAIDRLEQVVAWQVERVERKWAGLRSFAPDRLPVYGFDPAVPGFFWCAGQGGFGIQTAPAGAKLAAALLLGAAPDPMVAGIDPGRYRATRFR